MKEKWAWDFVGFKSEMDGCPVQDWFDLLPEDHRFEIIDQLTWLRALTSRRWTRPDFDPLENEGGISEIRIPEIRTDLGSIYYRIYGVFGARELSRSYIFLHGTNKEVANDIEGKQIAKCRFGELAGGRAEVHKFDFEKGFASQAGKKS